MILNHKYKFIFFKNRKTAGTSLEIALSKFCGSHDVITPITESDEIIRTEFGYLGPQNFLPPLSSYPIKHLVGFIAKRERVKFYSHIPPIFAKKFIDTTTWNTYYKFCFDRNPYDKVISGYYWDHLARDLSLSEYIHDYPGRWSDFNGYFSDDLLVDMVYKYEELTSALGDIVNKLNLPEEISLNNIKAKANIRKDRRHYSQVLKPQDMQAIQEQYSKEINYFGY